MSIISHKNNEMNIYTNFWKDYLAYIKKQIKSSVAIKFSDSHHELSSLGDRSDYNGFAVFWMGKEEKYTDKAVFRDLLKAVKQDDTKMMNSAIGRLEIRVQNNIDIISTYQPITFETILDKYEQIQNQEDYLREETYKWELVQQFQDQWKLYENKEISFVDFFKSINFDNLIFTTCVTIYKHVMTEVPIEFEKLINYLFDESLDLQERIFNYRQEFDKLYFSIQNHGKNTFEEERTIATWLAFRYPDKYTFYKDEFYTKLCKGLGITVQKPLYKLVHYYSIVNDFILNNLNNRQGLISKNKEQLNDKCYKDFNNYILAQDILYETLITSKAIESKEISEEEIQKQANNLQSKMNIPLNQILYGPPGTGKTYHTINKALEILGYDLESKYRKEIKEEYEKNVKAGKIVFTTFHQSMSYEDFIEGIKPRTVGKDVVYEVQDGLFKKISKIATSNFENAKIENQGKVVFEEAFEKLKEEVERNPELKFPLKTIGYEFKIIGFTDYSIQFEKASGGTGHTLSINTLRELYYGKVYNFKQGVSIYYPGILDKLNSFSSSQEKVKQENFVIIIDEINRGNVSQIFGELITLIEEDKRIGQPEELMISMPYNKEETFGVPPNLYIIGTMNTADRSVEALDTALRRRFVFEEMNPDASLIATLGKSNSSDGIIEDIDLVAMLKTMNQRIEKLLDKDHQIGHAFFMSVMSKTDLEIVFKNKIIPLLQEYFYGDYGKIGLVLGESFIELETASSSFASFKHVDNDVKSDYQHKKIFKFTPSKTWVYKSIYANTNE